MEDEAIVALHLTEALQRLGFVPIGCVDTGEAAVALAADTTPDLILMDIRLAGGMDGIEAATAIRSQGGPSVIYLTAQADAETLKRAAMTEPLGYVFKPYTSAVLQTAIDQAIRRQQRR